jgi:hypothetical protein
METQPKFKFGDWLQEEGSSPFCVGIIHKTNIDYFYSDEAYKPFHQESRLKLIERPKRKVKKRFYMMAFINAFGQWAACTALVTIDFKDSRGNEVMAGYERKIMENSPYIELDCDE